MRLLIVLCVLFTVPPVAAQELCPNPGMEEGQRGRSPDGWVHNAYGELAAHTTWDDTMRHGGNASLRLECSVFRGGAAQAYLPVPAVTQGRSYTLRAWMRGEGLASPVRLMIRDLGPPYHSYLENTALVTDQWRPVVAMGEANAGGAAVGVFVLFQSAGTLWVDDLSLMVGDHPPSEDLAAPPVVKGNLVQNSGFELGMTGWTMPEMVAIEENGLEGRCAHWLNKSPYMLEGRPVALKPGQRYTFSAWLRSPDEGMRVVMGLHEVGGSDCATREFAAPADWQRCHFSFTAQPEQNPRYYLQLSRAGEGRFLVDNVQLEEGDLTDYAPASAPEVAIDLPRSLRFPGVGEELTVGVLTAGASGARDETGPVSLVATDYYGVEVARIPVATSRPRSEVALRLAEPGFASLALMGGPEGETVLDEAQVCVTRPPVASLEGDGFFGAHGTEGEPGEYHAATAMARAGARSWRLHDMPSYTQWFMVQPEKDRRVWHDEELDALLARGIRVLGVFCRTPRWAGRDPGGEPVDPMAWPPRDWDEFGEYVFRTVDHYRTRIKHWEVWNEPWGRGFWAGTPEEYATLLQVAHTQTKRADPDCVIIGGCFWPPMPEFTDRVLATGAIQYMDAVSYHHYCEPDAVASGQVRSWYEHMRQRVDAAGGKDLPLWMTEGGTACPSYYWWMGRRDQARAAAEAVAKQLIETKSLGAGRFFYYYAWQETGSPRMFHGLANGWYTHPLLEWDGSPKTTYAAYAAAACALTGTRPAGSLEQGRLRAHVFAGQGETVLALWARDALLEPLVLRVDLGPQVEVRDLMGARREVVRDGAACVLRLQSGPLYARVAGLAHEEIIRGLQATQ